MKFIPERNAIFEITQPSNGAKNTKAPTKQPKIQECDALQNKLNSIYNDKEKDNKEKLKLIRDLFHDEIMTFYKNSFDDLVNISREEVMGEYLIDFYTERMRCSDSLLKKYEFLTKEYQN